MAGIIWGQITLVDRKPESFRDVSISNTVTSEQRKEVETLMKQYPDVLSSLPGRTDQIQQDIKLLTSEPIRTKGCSIPYRRVASWKRFLFETDHKPLSFMQTAKVLNPRIMRWAMKLQPYRFRIVAIRGRDNLGADYLSRSDLIRHRTVVVYIVNFCLKLSVIHFHFVQPKK